jgi:TonB dependent receptor
MFVGGSFEYSERALDPPSIDPILHDTGYTGRVFGRFDYAPCEVNRYELFATYAHNRFQVPLDPTAQPYNPAMPVQPTDQYGNAAPAFIPHDTNATETEDEAFVALSFVHKLGTNEQIQIAPLYKLSRGALNGDAEHALGDGSDPGATSSDVTRLAHHAGAVATYTNAFDHHAFKTGAQVDGLYGVTNFTSYGRDDAAGGGIDPALTAHGTDTTYAVTSGAFAQDHMTFGKLAIDAGVRVDELHVILQGGQTNDSAGVSPRLGASVSVTKDTVIHAFTGVNWQPPSPLDAANAARALGVVPANQPVVYDLKPETDLYAETGVSSRLADPLRAGLVAWGRYAYNQLDDTAIGSTSLLSNYNFRRGRAAGLEADAELRLGPWLSAFANGSYGFAEGRGISSAKFLFTAEELADNSWQTLDHAQTLTGNAGATVRDGRFTGSLVAAYGSGLRTGPDNNEHVPGHVRTDAGMQYTFVPRGYPLRVGIDIINLFDAHYAYRIANGFVGSSYGAPRSVYVSLSIPLAKEPHRPGEK